MKNLLISFSIIFLLSCSAKIRPLSQTDADRAKTKFSDATLASLTEGKSLYEQNCAKCHGLKSPTGHSEEQWKTIVPRMVQKANKKMGKEEIDGSKEQLILQYLITMSTAPK